MKVKNVSMSTLYIQDDKGGTIIIGPHQIKDLPEKYISLFPGKLIPAKEPVKEQVKETAGEQNKKNYQRKGGK